MGRHRAVSAGVRRPKVQSIPKPSEAAILRACMDVLEAHPSVGMWWRQNTGSVQIQGRWVKFGFRGASDLMGILNGGRFLAVECKAPGKKPTTEQVGFLQNVTVAGGLALLVFDAGKLKETLDMVCPLDPERVTW